MVYLVPSPLFLRTSSGDCHELLARNLVFLCLPGFVDTIHKCVCRCTYNENPVFCCNRRALMCTYTRMHSEGLRHALSFSFPYLLYLESFFFFFFLSTASLIDAFQSRFVSDICLFLQKCHSMLCRIYIHISTHVHCGIVAW